MVSATDLRPSSDLYADHLTRLTTGYAAVMAAHGLDAVVLHTGSMRLKSVFDNKYWPFEMVGHTRHWAPLTVPDSAIVIRPGSKPQIILNVARDYWDAPAEPESDHIWPHFDVVEVNDADAVAPLLPKGRVAFIGEDMPIASQWGFAAEQIAPPAVMLALDELRVAKSAYEVWCLREANRRAAFGHAAVVRAFLDGEHSELDLHLEYLRATKQDDPETPYKNIVALGEHAATLHHVGYGRSATAAQSLLLDAGASCFGYDSDITRTVCKGASAAAETFRALTKAVNDLQQVLCGAVRMGEPYQGLHNQTHNLLADALISVGVAKAGTSAGHLVDSGITRKFMPHGLGHSLGIQTHDVGCRRIEPEPRNPFLRNTSTIVVGQVFTIEPGCYFIEDLLGDLRVGADGTCIDWGLVDALAPFGGVRVEDDLHVMASGEIDNLTRAFLPA